MQSRRPLRARSPPLEEKLWRAPASSKNESAKGFRLLTVCRASAAVLLSRVGGNRAAATASAGL